jgi:amidophosphoribosyltransferase
MGEGLAREFPIDIDVVVPVPDSGVPAALGYAQASGMPYEMGIIRSHYLGRTFIQPSQGARQKGVAMKHSAQPGRDRGQEGRADRRFHRARHHLGEAGARMVREAGATEVHLRSASPPIQWPDFYGIDMPDRDHLIAANKTMEEMREMLEVDSLGFLSVDGLYKAMGETGATTSHPQFTDHYFTGDYPTRLVDREIAEGRNDLTDRQLSFLVDA